MLMKMVSVDKEGKFKVAGDVRVLYACMMLIRTRICFEMCNSTFIALTIALRYAVVRRQFATLDKSKQERQVIDY
jgi:hypothetical protein